jgi:hypothetical protein
MASLQRFFQDPRINEVLKLPEDANADEKRLMMCIKHTISRQLVAAETLKETVETRKDKDASQKRWLEKCKDSMDSQDEEVRVLRRRVELLSADWSG